MPDRNDRAHLEETAAIFRKKWQPLVVSVLLERGPLGFSDIASSFDELSDKMLSQTLENLRDRELVSRRVISESPRRVEYSLTRRGAALEPVLESMVAWGADHGALSESPVVVLADDDGRLAEMHRGWLDESFDAEAVTTAQGLLDAVDQDVDAVVLERHLSGVDDEELLGRLRGPGLDCRVVMLTSIPPAADLVDFDVDAYLLKPVDRETLLATVEQVVARLEHDESVRRYLAARSKRMALEAHHSVDDVDADRRFDALNDRIDELGDAVDERQSDLLPPLPTEDRSA